MIYLYQRVLYKRGLFLLEGGFLTVKQPYNTTIYNTALYLRLSRDDELQGESGSIQTQRMMLRQYAAEHGLTVVDEYIDDGWSGTNFERPSFQRMIDDIEDGKINCVVTKDLSRLGRNYILTVSTRKSISPAREYATLPSMTMWTPSTEKASLHRS